MVMVLCPGCLVTLNELCVYLAVTPHISVDSMYYSYSSSSLFPLCHLLFLHPIPISPLSLPPPLCLPALHFITSLSTYLCLPSPMSLSVCAYLLLLLSFFLLCGHIGVYCDCAFLIYLLIVFLCVFRTLSSWFQMDVHILAADVKLELITSWDHILCNDGR